LINCALILAAAFTGALSIWLELRGNASPFIVAAAGELARGVGGALLGYAFLYAFEIVAFILNMTIPRHP
jgi:hypothetical protein